MLKFLLVIVFMFICASVTWLMSYINTERSKKALLMSNTKLSIETVTSFSLYELTSRLKRYYGKEGKTILIEYADNQYVKINTKDSQTRMINMLKEVQSYMILRRYVPEEGYVVADYTSKIMHEIWLDYAYKRNYKRVFWREMDRMFEAGEVSKYLYNEVYGHFYKYKFLKNI